MPRTALLILLFTLTACGGAPQATEQATAAPTAIATATAAPTATEAPTETPAPTDSPTIEPTRTPKPTATIRPPTRTPRPTITMRPTNTPEPPTATPAPIALEGIGATVTDPIEIPDTLWRVFLSHRGESNFIVRAYGPDDEETGLTNDIGNYDGVRLLLSKGGQWFFEVRADGPWTMRLERLRFFSDTGSAAEGTGDYVTDLFAPERHGPVPYQFFHDGESNFIVQVLCSDGHDTVVNEIGPVDMPAVVHIEGDRCLWDVRADGNWSIKPR